MKVALKVKTTTSQKKSNISQNTTSVEDDGFDVTWHVVTFRATLVLCIYFFNSSIISLSYLYNFCVCSLDTATTPFHYNPVLYRDSNKSLPFDDKTTDVP